MNTVKNCFKLLFFMLILAPAAFGQFDIDLAMSRENVITQADIDSYIFLAPHLASEAAFNNPAVALKYIETASLTRNRAAYLVAKIPIVQAMAMGLLNAEGLERENVPLYLRPTPEEIKLVGLNIQSLLKAQFEAAK
ncbi:MAG: hypothetical protein ACRCTY_01280 [Candidatus Adiutrix sp.]